MENSINLGIKNLSVLRKKAQSISKDIYRDFARPLAKRFRAKAVRLYFRRAYKNGTKALNLASEQGAKFVQYAGRVYKVNQRKFRRSAFYLILARYIVRARKFVLSKYPRTKRTILGFAAVRYARATRLFNRNYPKVLRFVNKQYPVVRKWVITQLPRIQAFLAGQLSARVQRVAA